MSILVQLVGDEIKYFVALKTISKCFSDYRDFLVPTENANTLNSQSDGDTDDLIEDAKNYIRTAQV